MGKLVSMNPLALTLRIVRPNVCIEFPCWTVMSIARRWLLLLLVLCIPLQSSLALAGTVCKSAPASTSKMSMPMTSGHHNHAAMMAAQHAQNHDLSNSKHSMGGCAHCAHCPACSLSTGVSTLAVHPIFFPSVPETLRSDDVLISLILDTPQRPPQTV